MDIRPFLGAAFGWLIGLCASFALVLSGLIHGPAVFFATSAICGAGLGLGWRIAR
jgi:hypothetical protein